MIDRFEGFVVRITKPLDGLAFLFVLINGMIGITILADVFGSRALMFAGCGVGWAFYALCATILYRHNLRRKEDHADAHEQVGEEDQRQRLPRQFIRTGTIAVGFYPWAMLLAMHWPSLHPFRGEISIRFMAGLVLAVAFANLVVGFAGLADPRVCFAVNQSTRQLPLPIWSRIAGWMLLLGGFVAGGYVAYLIAR